MDSCPKCERKFEGIEDYPLVYIVSFERREIPRDVVFPTHDHTIFVLPGATGPDGKTLVNPKAPEAVVDFFRKHSKKEETFDHEGWIWYRGPLNSLYRTQKDARALILSHLGPYLGKLEGLVGQEVRTEEVIPRFQNPELSNFFSNSIAGTNYSLGINEEGKDPQGYRKALINIERSGYGTISILKLIATVGELTYEGRLLNMNHPVNIS